MTARRVRPSRRRRPAGRRARRQAAAAAPLRPEELESLRLELERVASAGRAPARWNAEPEDVQRSVMQLVLTLVEFIRRMLEGQAIRRVEEETLTPEETERIGVALMRLEETIQDLGRQFGLAPEDLRLDLGPIGKLM